MVGSGIWVGEVMFSRKGFLVVTVFLMIWMVPVSADETADEIVAMMGWWEEYGRYWDEIGTDAAEVDDETSFAWLDEEVMPVVRSKQ